MLQENGNTYLLLMRTCTATMEIDMEISQEAKNLDLNNHLHHPWAYTQRTPHATTETFVQPSSLLLYP